MSPSTWRRRPAGGSRALAARANVVLEHFRPGVAARLGRGWDDVPASNPRVIYWSISGFGQTGPYRKRGGFDRVAQGMSGVMSISGEEEGPPLPLPIPIADIGTGMFARIGILAAVAARARTGENQHVDTSLLARWSIDEASFYFATGHLPAHRASTPDQAFHTKDSWINLGGGSPGFWPQICARLGVAELVDDPTVPDPGRPRRAPEGT